MSKTKFLLLFCLCYISVEPTLPPSDDRAHCFYISSHFYYTELVLEVLERSLDLNSAL